MFRLRICAVNSSPEIFFLDHICPLASLLNIPLITTSENNVQLTAKYYPEIKQRYWPDLEFKLKELSEEFDALIECSYWSENLKHLFRSLFSKEMKLIFCPHGQSEKGFKAPSLTPYGWQEIVLIYGDLMKQMLIDLGIWNSIPLSLQVGNFRWKYYQVHKERLLAIAQSEIFSHLKKGNRTLLYAPTWMDEEGSSTFFDFSERLLDELPSDWNLIIKIHPLLPERHPAMYYRLASLQEARSNYLLVSTFPLIYPLLDGVDAYLGDYSSVGYDALAFNKPLFFLTRSHLPVMKLHSCGHVLDPTSNLFKAIDQRIQCMGDYHPQQKALYREAFASQDNLREVFACLE